MEEFGYFLGRFHPLIVHLPIGFLMLGFLMKAYQKWKPQAGFGPAISFALLLSTLSGVAACVLGFLLSGEGGYEAATLNLHMWMGILLTLLSAVAYIATLNKITWLSGQAMQWSIQFMIIVVVSLTGHMGGNMTHGEEYLTEYAPFREKEEEIKLASLDQVVVYEHVIQPILTTKCASCHGKNKKKGALSFESIATLEKGGKTGPAFVAHQSDQSEMIRRTLLSKDDKKVMPPKGKVPLTDEEIQLLIGWVDQGASFEATLEKPGEAYGKLVAAYLKIDGTGTHATVTQIPLDSSALIELAQSGFVIKPLVTGSGMLDVTLPSHSISSESAIEEALDALEKIKENVIWLNLSGVGLKDEHLKRLSGLKNCKKLRLEKNEITDVGIPHLSGLTNLESLNLYGTSVSNQSVPTLTKLKALEKVYGWQTQLEASSDLPFELVL
ncbi:MAG: c-type cytochrome domain-containing protein [Bacteroidota bacterium]